ncbi:MAG: hypothetical protein HYZ96_01165 [Candidatus Omnitrophica bacterium]|nr:hypothetical protein [Candidatus Omnitrophota bacterium]
MVYVEFRQRYEGLDVEGTYVQLAVKLLEDRSVMVSAQAQLYPTLSVRPATPRAVDTCEQQAAEALGVSAKHVTLLKAQRRLRYLGGRWRRIHEVRYAERTDKVAVDEDTGQTWLEEDRVYATIQGRVRGRGVLFDPIATGTTLATLDHQDLRVTTTGGSTTYTDATGVFNFPTETAPTTVNAALAGRWAAVTSLTSPTLNFSGPATPGVPLSILFNPVGAEELATAQVNGYYHTTFIHEWVTPRLAGPLPAIDIALPTKVNLNDLCNAFYDFFSINFFKAGGGCINTAYETVVYHEYGHFVDDKAGGITNGGLSEGWGDVLAAFGTNQPLIGEGFFGPGTFIRTANNAYQYNPTDEIHTLGQAWAGFAWDLRKNLIQSLGQAQGIAVSEQLIIPVFLANSPDIPAAVFQVLLLDDTDGDLSNGSPHQPDILDAANKHGIPIAELDSVPPAPVNNLAAQPAGLSRIGLTWTATGDDGLQGTATSYDVRFALAPILTDADFQAATQVPGEPAPHPSGQAEQMTVTGLVPGTTYHFAMKVADNMGNVSLRSNPASATPSPPVILYTTNFESGMAGWTATGLWHLSSARSNSPIRSLSYNDGVDYETGARNAGSLTSPAIALPATGNEALLVFFHWFQTEQFAGVFDVRQVQVSQDGVNWVVLKQWDSRDPNQVFWAPFAIDLSAYLGQTIRLRFFFDTVDALFNNFEGWYVDDVTVFWKAPNQPPVLNPIGNKSTSEGQLLQFTISASDPDGDPLTYSTGPLPAGSSFTPSTRVFSWTPGFNQAGSPAVLFSVSDGIAADSETITIVVKNVPLAVKKVSDSPDPFSPNGDGRRDQTTLKGTLNHAATGTLQVKTLAGSVKRSFAFSNVASVSQAWDGKDTAGIRVADGTYTYVLTGTDVGGSTASRSSTVTVDTTAPAISNLSDAPDPFRPSLGQSTTISFTLSEPALVTLKVYNSAGKLIRTLLSNALKTTPSNSVVWNGRNQSGVLVPPGVYTYKLWVSDKAGNRASPYPTAGTVAIQ